MGKNKFKTDPVCGSRMNRNKAYVVIEYKDCEYLICCPTCQSEFESHPDRYAASTRDDLRQTT